MTYGNSADLTLLCNSIADSVSSGLHDFALEIADTWVAGEIGSLTGTLTSTPDMLEKAATYYAYVFILRNLYDTSEMEAANMNWFETQANNLIQEYVAQNTNERSTVHPYSGNLTPTNVFTQRDKRTDRDDTNYDDVDSTRWDAEE